MTSEYILLKLKETFDSFKLGWEVLANVRTDGDGNKLAISVMPVSSGMAFRCGIHKEALCCKMLPLEMKYVTHNVTHSEIQGRVKT
jgi:hypothetical protein